jgi:hypothetical protein
MTALAASGAYAEKIYRTVDDKGNVVFSQSPPKGQAATVVTPKVSHPGAPPSAPVAAADKDGKSTDTKATGKPAAGGKLTPEQLAVKRENCENARKEIAQFQNRRLARLRTEDENGNQTYITPEQIQSRVDAANEEVEKNCDEE